MDAAVAVVGAEADGGGSVGAEAEAEAETDAEAEEGFVYQSKSGWDVGRRPVGRIDTLLPR